MAPGDEWDLTAMLDFGLGHDCPVSIRYPKATAEQTHREQRAPIELGRAEVLDWGHDGMLIACGTLLGNCLKAAAQLREIGLDVGVINARFVKPLDTDAILRAVESAPFVITVEEGALMGGFGSAVLEAACDAGLDASKVRRLGIPDRFIEHGERGELLADLGLDVPGIVRACQESAALHSHASAASRRRVS
jgi:1-deoxy-D-xylulose-5-phosphate synthase